MHSSGIAEDDACPEQGSVQPETLPWKAGHEDGGECILLTWHEDGKAGRILRCMPLAGPVALEEDQTVDGLLAGVLDAHNH